MVSSAMSDLPQIADVEGGGAVQPGPPGLVAGKPHQPGVQFQTRRLEAPAGCRHHLEGRSRDISHGRVSGGVRRTQGPRAPHTGNRDAGNNTSKTSIQQERGQTNRTQGQRLHGDMSQQPESCWFNGESAARLQQCEELLARSPFTITLD